MKIIVLNGSPKGKKSVTMQSVALIENHLSADEFKYHHISQRIRKLEKDSALFDEIVADVADADLVLWAFPVYFLLVPSQYKRFIELIFERGKADSFKDRYTAVLSTSIHFFDHTAHNYMRAICEDLGMRFADSFSADMDDLLKREERERLLLFADEVKEIAAGNCATTRKFPPLSTSDFEYQPSDPTPVDLGGKKVLILTDDSSTDSNQGKMVGRLQSSFRGDVETINLHDVSITGGCLGCCKCGLDNECCYGGKDEYVDFYNTKVKAADIIIAAGRMSDRYLSARWKMFFDRSFFNNHSPTLVGKQIGYVVSGSFSQDANTRQVLEAWTECQKGNVVGIVTDEHPDSAEIDSQLQGLAERSVRCADSGYVSPPSFLSVGGMKIFRDDVYGRLGVVMHADHRYYKKHGIYRDFPQNERMIRLKNSIIRLLVKIPGFKKEFKKRLVNEMFKPHQKALAKAIEK